MDQLDISQVREHYAAREDLLFLKIVMVTSHSHRSPLVRGGAHFSCKSCPVTTIKLPLYGNFMFRSQNGSKAAKKLHGSAP